MCEDTIQQVMRRDMKVLRLSLLGSRTAVAMWRCFIALCSKGSGKSVIMTD